MKLFIFLTDEGFTYSGKEDTIEPDVENLQVLGFSQGINEKEAFNRFMSENRHLAEKGFDEIICLQIKGGLESAPRFYISENRDEN